MKYVLFSTLACIIGCGGLEHEVTDDTALGKAEQGGVDECKTIYEPFATTNDIAEKAPFDRSEVRDFVRARVAERINRAIMLGGAGMLGRIYSGLAARRIQGKFSLRESDENEGSLDDEITAANCPGSHRKRSSAEQKAGAGYTTDVRLWDVDYDCYCRQGNHKIYATDTVTGFSRNDVPLSPVLGGKIDTDGHDTKFTASLGKYVRPAAQPSQQELIEHVAGELMKIYDIAHDELWDGTLNLNTPAEIVSVVLSFRIPVADPRA
ncbi:MAG: hypothetical protein H6707_04155 [Deltaproteobacteria bacterium]|nr:hypothetical protein [Deltaproteobacteria bacterium]